MISHRFASCVLIEGNHGNTDPALQDFALSSLRQIGRKSKAGGYPVDWRAVGVSQLHSTTYSSPGQNR